jgi:Ni,Fe-hydrogenase III small subunit
MADLHNTLLWTVLSRLSKLFVSRGLYTDQGDKPKKRERNWIARWIVRLRGRSIYIRHLDTGSSNGIELSINALHNPRYDIERLGFHFVASPRHADLLLATGPMTYNMIPAVEATFDAMPYRPRYIVTVGDDVEGGIFRDAYGLLGCIPRDDMQDSCIGHIQGPVPRPRDILTELCSIVDAEQSR